MTTRLRFLKSADVFAAFPTLAHYAAPPPDDIDPLGDVRRRIADRRALEAIALLAHTLPRREAVWWASRSVAALLGPGAEDECARAAEAWVRAPDSENQRAALERGLAAPSNKPTTWLALAAGRSGGNVAPADQPPVPAAPEACAQAVGAAVVLAIVSHAPADIPDRLSACIAGGIAFAEGGDLKIQPDPAISLK